MGTCQYNTQTICLSLKKYETGKVVPYPETIFRICGILGNCDAGYLLGLYDEATKDIHEICSFLGISEAAAESLLQLKTSKPDVASRIIATREFSNFAALIKLIFSTCDFVDNLSETIEKGTYGAEEGDGLDALFFCSEFFFLSSHSCSF